MIQLFKRFKRNVVGRDFLVGDVHGEFDVLRKLLKGVAFDIDKDRLFSVGDLIDRGPQSEEVIEWLARPWFHAVRGNHEQMALEGSRLVPGMAECHVINGGMWFWRMSMQDRARYAEVFDTLPLVIEVGTEHGAVGIVHAEPTLPDWAEFAAGMEDLSLPVRKMSESIWGRLRIASKNTVPVANVHRVYVGHSPVATPLMLGNVCYIDTGASTAGKGHMTLADINSEEAWSLPAPSRIKRVRKKKE